MTTNTNVGYGRLVRVPEPEEICKTCGCGPEKRKLEIWAPDGVMGWNHGCWSWRCRRCCARDQLRHALGRVWAIPRLLWRSR